MIFGNDTDQILETLVVNGLVVTFLAVEEVLSIEKESPQCVCESGRNKSSPLWCRGKLKDLG